jgi:hypothetical protein
VLAGRHLKGLPRGGYAGFRIVDVRRVNCDGKQISHDVDDDMPLTPAIKRKFFGGAEERLNA